MLSRTKLGVYRDKGRHQAQAHKMKQPSKTKKGKSLYPNVHMAQAPPMQQAGGFLYSFVPPPTLVNVMGQNSGENTVDPITISDLDDPKEQEKIQKESSEQSENNEA